MINLEEHITNFVINTVPADGLALSDVRKSEGIMLAKIRGPSQYKDVILPVEAFHVKDKMV